MLVERFETVEAMNTARSSMWRAQPACAFREYLAQRSDIELPAHRCRQAQGRHAVRAC
jgi:hypothetical protein